LCQYLFLQIQKILLMVYGQYYLHCLQYPKMKGKIETLLLILIMFGTVLLMAKFLPMY